MYLCIIVMVLSLPISMDVYCTWSDRKIEFRAVLCPLSDIFHSFVRLYLLNFVIDASIISDVIFFFLVIFLFLTRQDFTRQLR